MKARYPTFAHIRAPQNKAAKQQNRAAIGERQQTPYPTHVFGEMHINELNQYENAKVPRVFSNETKDKWDARDGVHFGKKLTMSDLANSQNSETDQDMAKLLSEIENLMNHIDPRKEPKVNQKRIAELERQYEDILKTSRNSGNSGHALTHAQSVDRLQELMAQIKIVHGVNLPKRSRSSKNNTKRKTRVRSRSQSASRSPDNKKHNKNKKRKTRSDDKLTASKIEQLTRSNRSNRESVSNGSLHLSDLR